MDEKRIHEAVGEVLAKTRELSTDPAERIAILRSAAHLIENQVSAQTMAQAIFNALKGGQ